MSKPIWSHHSGHSVLLLWSLT
uniref:Uncharacterized protein n=1 Tax=Anguilla anguilla TaxID=7936 RepID=A0A0E9PWT2_ANGAN